MSNSTGFWCNSLMHSLDKCQTVLVFDVIVPCIHLTCQTALAFDAIVPALTFLPVWWVSRCLPSAQRSQGCSSSLCCNSKSETLSDKESLIPSHSAHLTRHVVRQRIFDSQSYSSPYKACLGHQVTHPHHCIKVIKIHSTVLIITQVKLFTKKLFENTPDETSFFL